MRRLWFKTTSSFVTRKVYQMDADKRRRKVEDTAEANAARLIKEEEVSKSQRERRKKKEGPSEETIACDVI